jgi:hypothetical protein
MNAIVLDEEYTDALLGLAASERLLEVPNREFFERKKQERPDLIDSLLATVVSHDQIVLPITALYGHEIPIKGTLLDRLDISFLTREEEIRFASADHPMPLFSSQASLVAYLNACGLDVTDESLETALNDFDYLSAEFTRRFGQDDTFKFRINDLVADLFGGKGTVNDVDREFLNSYDATSRLIRSSAGHIARLSNQIRRANELGADILLSKPLGESASSSLDSAKIRSIAQLETVDISKMDRSNLFQFIALNIGSVPYRSTLAESAALAKTPEAEDLRLMTRQLFDDLGSGGTTDLVQLRKEIDTARRSMRRSERWSQASNIMTTIGVPLSALGFVSSDASMIGLGVSFLSTYALGYAWFGKSGASRWVKFGKSDI